MITYKISDTIKTKLRNIIYDYNGGEIFFGCIISDEGIIKDIVPVCFGNDEAVLAPYKIVNKFNAIMHNHPSGNTKPSSQDLYYAEYLQNEGIGFFIINNDASELTTVVPPIVVKNKELLDLNTIYKYFSENGLIKEKIDSFEYREGQQTMSCFTAEAFNENKIAIIEAGTGIGKSLAYLIPAFLWAEKNNERIIISTNTLNLQSQLLNKDIPLVKNILKSNLNALVVKGRRNYLCKLKIYNLQNELEFDEEAEEINSILKWSTTTENGEIDELTFVPSGSAWEKAASEVDFCVGRHCNFYQACFFQAARRKASESNILIVNHHILFADVDIRSQGRGLDENILLPPYRKIIFDEAHNIVKSASSYFSYSFSKPGFYKFLSYIRKKGDRGFLPNLYKKLHNSSNNELSEIGSHIYDETLKVLSFLFNSSFEIFDKINIYLEKIIKNNTYNSNNKINIQYRIKKDEWNSDDFRNNFLAYLNQLADKIEELEKSFDYLQTKFDQLNKDIKAQYDIDIKLVKSYQNKIVSLYQNIINLINIDDKEYITWLEITGDAENPNFKINATPLYINKILYENVHEVFDTIVYSSATLTVNKTFDYFKTTSGLSFVDNNKIICEMIESPFDYQNNVLFTAPQDIPEPNSSEYNDRLNSFLKNTLEITNGSSFVLFTSYSQLKKSYEDVNAYLTTKGQRSYYQGEMEKSKLLDKFKAEVNSNLFATSSFWEGVDAPGRTLRCVILAKLPFSIPTEPIEEARIEEMEKRGINSFISYTLPQAVLKFRQGFGRLIRKKDDYGIVAILDSRILKKSYGSIFIKSIPDCRFITGSVTQVLKEISDHIDRHE